MAQWKRCAYARLVRTRLVSLVCVITMFGVACTAADPGVTATRSRQGGGGAVVGGDPNENKTYELIPGVVDFGANKQPKPWDAYLTVVFADLASFWEQAFPETYGEPWQPLTGGVWAAYPDRQEVLPGGCNQVVNTPYEMVQMNAFYCSGDDFIAYDDEQFLQYMADNAGKEGIAVMLAHEYGHLVQFRGHQRADTVVANEQQADCFSGAWAAHLAAGESQLLQFSDADIRRGLLGMLALRDEVQGSGLDDPGAHGTGFDRVGAFQDGFEGGPTRCAAFFDENRILVDIPFDNTDQYGGNLPLVDPAPDPTNGPSDIVTLFPASLDQFWTELATANNVPFTAPTWSAFGSDGPYPSCAGVADDQWSRNAIYCAADNTIYWDQDYALQLSQDQFTGDLSVGYLFSNAYSDAIQNALHSKTTGEQRALRNDCLTGAWVASAVPPVPDTAVIQLSAGDLDEAIIMAIVRSDPATDTNVNGSAFEKIDAFRTGVLGGLNVCRNL